jgi:predicted nucleic acid-binding protein
MMEESRLLMRDTEPAGIDRWWRRYSERNTASPKLWMDAYLAAFARAEGCTLVTTDGAFKQFDGLDYLILG